MQFQKEVDPKVKSKKEKKKSGCPKTKRGWALKFVEWAHIIVLFILAIWFTWDVITKWKEGKSSFRDRLCTSELWLKLNCRLQVNCRIKFEMACQLLAKPVLLYCNSLSVCNSLLATIHLYMIRPLVYFKKNGMNCQQQFYVFTLMENRPN